MHSIVVVVAGQPNLLLWVSSSKTVEAKVSSHHAPTQCTVRSALQRAIIPKTPNTSLNDPQCKRQEAREKQASNGERPLRFLSSNDVKQCVVSDLRWFVCRVSSGVGAESDEAGEVR